MKLPRKWGRGRGSEGGGGGHRAGEGLGSLSSLGWADSTAATIRSSFPLISQPPGVSARGTRCLVIGF